MGQAIRAHHGDRPFRVDPWRGKCESAYREMREPERIVTLRLTHEEATTAAVATAAVATLATRILADWALEAGHERRSGSVVASEGQFVWSVDHTQPLRAYSVSVLAAEAVRMVVDAALRHDWVGPLEYRYPWERGKGI